MGQNVSVEALEIFSLALEHSNSVDNESSEIDTSLALEQSLILLIGGEPGPLSVWNDNLAGINRLLAPVADLAMGLYFTCLFPNLDVPSISIHLAP